MAVELTLGKLALLTAAVAGVTAVAATLGPFFVVLKVAGGAYLLWLVVRMLHCGTHTHTGQDSAGRSCRTTTTSGGRGVGLGALLTLSNPQVLLFYIAVLPTVLNSQNITSAQYLLLCVTLIPIMGAVAFGLHHSRPAHPHGPVAQATSQG